MIRRLLIRKVVTACVLTAILTTTSMVALAAPGRVAAELTVSGRTSNGEAPAVLVNGEPSKSGRSIFSSSTITTPEEATAQINIGRTGRIELSPNSSMNLIFDDKSVDAELSSGKLTVLGSLGTVKVRTNDGKTTTLNPGESINASGQAQGSRQSSGGSDDYLIWLIIGAAAAVAVIIAVSQSSDDDNVSPNR